MDSNYSRPNPKAPPPGLNLPVSMGPIALPPAPPRKRRWGFLLLWTGLVFAGGAVAGFVGKDSVIRLGQQVGVNLGSQPAVLSQTVAPVAAPTAEAAPVPAPKAEPVAAPSPSPAPPPSAKAEPAPEPIKAAAETKPAAEPVKAAHAAPSHAESPEPVAEASGKHSKASAKSAAASASAAASRKPGFDDPFHSDGDSAPAAKPAPSRKAEAVPAAKSESAKSTAKSSALDDLMADTPSDGKGKKRDNKDIDALLKDVQKPRAEPAPKKAEPAPAQPLSAADIARVMNVVKARSKECSAKLGQKGVAELKITVAKSGSVSDVSLGGKLAGTPVGACIEKATRAASFPPSSGLTFDYRVDAR